ncbi:signal peptide-tamavidin 1 [Lentinula raphanica]|nr:signal peptide-tamavidin 1 [Lentinula raphanica]
MSIQSKQQPEPDWLKKLSGKWYNELGSIMILFADGKGGLTGEYNSAVGNAEYWYILAGRFETAPPPDEGLSLGWAVSWRNEYRNAHSTATWSGQYFSQDSLGPERILTQWLLTTSTNTDNVWSSTGVGHDTFVRDKPSLEAIAKAKALRINSPHPEQIIAKRLKEQPLKT